MLAARHVQMGSFALCLRSQQLFIRMNHGWREVLVRNQQVNNGE